MAPIRVAVLGHPDNAARDAIQGLVKQLGLQSAVPQTTPAGAGAWYAPVERMGEMEFAVLLLPAQAADAGGLPKSLAPELLLELGYLLGTPGRNRVCLLSVGPGAKAPTCEGVAGLAMDEAGLWRLLLARAMKQAGLDVDLNRAL